jgi:paraquat-inducible protein A
MTDELIACPDCDALHRTLPLPDKSTAYCTRCGAALYRQSSGKLAHMVAFSLAALIALLIANSFPIVEVTTHGLISRTTLPGAAVHLWKSGEHLVAAIVIGSTVVLPLLNAFALLWLFIPLCRNRQPHGFALVLRIVQAIRPWCMIEVFMLGALVTLVKLSSVARIIPEAALFALGFFTLLLTLMLAFDLRQLWVLAPVAPQRGSNTLSSARSAEELRR